jgi:hypothetical protein
MREQLNKAQYILNYGWSALVRKKDKLKDQISKIYNLYISICTDQ